MGIIFVCIISQTVPAFALAITTGTTKGYSINGVSTTTSSNWAGYIENGGTFTNVSASWNIPLASPAAGTAEASDATWVGIGGTATRDLIQAGTQAILINGQTSYQAWYEILPASSTPMPITVNPGDFVTASIFESSPNLWTIRFSDSTNGQNYSAVVPYASSHSSAEWIEEMPSWTGGPVIPLDNFGTVQFQNAFSTKNGISGNLTVNGAQAMTMLNSLSQVLAAPSAIGNDQTSFSVTRNMFPSDASVNPAMQIRLAGNTEAIRPTATTIAAAPAQIYRTQPNTAKQQRTIAARNRSFMRFRILLGIKK